MLWSNSSCTENLKSRFPANDRPWMRRGLQGITSHRSPTPHAVENHQLDELNMFYCRFDKPTFSPLTLSTSHKQHPLPSHRLSSLKPHLQLGPLKKSWVSSSGGRRPRRHQVQTASHPPASMSALTSWSPSSPRSSTLQQIPEALWSPLKLQVLCNHPIPKKPPITG